MRCVNPAFYPRDSDASTSGPRGLAGTAPPGRGGFQELGADSPASLPSAHGLTPAPPAWAVPCSGPLCPYRGGLLTTGDIVPADTVQAGRPRRRLPGLACSPAPRLPSPAPAAPHGSCCRCLCGLHLGRLAHCCGTSAATNYSRPAFLTIVRSLRAAPTLV